MERLETMKKRKPVDARCSSARQSAVVWGRFLVLALAMAGLAFCGEENKQSGPDPTPTPVVVENGQLAVVGFNVESRDAEMQTVSDLVATVRGEAIWGFSEVANQTWAERWAAAAGVGESASYQWLLGTTGRDIRLAFAYHPGIVELLDSFELHEINVGGNVRAPLVGRFRHRASGMEFLFMVNHLYRSREERRHQQARLLNEWGAAQALPVIAAGDYNFDWDVKDGDKDHDLGYDLLTANDVFVWVRPDDLIKTQCSERYNSVLDFVFIAGTAKIWPADSEILASQKDYCPDDALKSDHRPVMAVFETTGN